MRRQFNYLEYQNIKFTKISAKKCYDNFIFYCKSDTKVAYHKYLEKHHILPKSLGGDNSKDNLVNLTYPEHIFAHYLLTIIYPNNYGLSFAFMIMSHSKNGEKLNFSDFSNFERIKIKMSEKDSNIHKGNKNPMYGKKQSKETIRKRVESRKGYKHSEETKARIRNSNIGKKISDETKEKLRQSHLGKKASKATKEKMSLKRKGKKLRPHTLDEKINHCKLLNAKTYNFSYNDLIYKGYYRFQVLEFIKEHIGDTCIFNGKTYKISTIRNLINDIDIDDLIYLENPK